MIVALHTPCMWMVLIGQNAVDCAGFKCLVPIGSHSWQKCHNNVMCFSILRVEGYLGLVSHLRIMVF